MLNSGGGDIRLCVDDVRCGFVGVAMRKSAPVRTWWLLFTIFEMKAGGNTGDFSGDFGLFSIVAYSEPSNGPWVCNESTNLNRIETIINNNAFF